MKPTKKEIQIYGNLSKEPIKQGTHKGYDWRIIVVRGSHPCAYIKIPKSSPIHNISYNDIDLNVHGGLTYSNKENNEYWIGWDYAHAGDYTHYVGGIFEKDTELKKIMKEREREEKKWTIEEIERDIKKAIDNIGLLKKYKVKQEYYFAIRKREW